jgi:hypothetical protein
MAPTHICRDPSDAFLDAKLPSNPHSNLLSTTAVAKHLGAVNHLGQGHLQRVESVDHNGPR